MIFEVEMLAFGEPGEIRRVDVPDEHANQEDIHNVLEGVFYWGQNDFQPQQHPSVSAGDVIRCRGENWLVAGVGFKKLTDEQLTQYRGVERRDRWLVRDDFKHTNSSS